jgi:hypothetical protein
MAPPRTTFAGQSAEARPASRRPPRFCWRLPGFAAAVLFPLMASCKGDGKPVWQFEGHISHSKFWEYHDHSAEPLCPTLLELLDEHTQTVGGKIGLTVEESRPLRYYRFADKTALAAGCPSDVAACAYEDAVLAQEPFYAHEQVHTYVARVWGQSIGLLNEGEAVALSCDPSSWPLWGLSPRDALDAGDWRSLLYLDGNSSKGYSAAGYWVTYLARKFGWGKVGELHRRALPGLSADDFAIEFARVFPVSMDRSWSEALSGTSPPCDSGWICRGIGMSPGEVARPACDGELHRFLEITHQPGVVLEHRTPLLLENCADPASPVYELVPTRYATTSWVVLPPGTYRIFGEYKAPSDFTFVSHLPSPFLAADCAQAGKVTLTPNAGTTIDLLPGTVDGCLRLDGANQAYKVYLFYVELPATGNVVVCDSTDPGASCIPVPTGSWTTLTIGADATMRLQNARSTPPVSRSWAEILFYPATPVDAGS